MPRIRKFNKGQFNGNRYTSNESKVRPNSSSPGSSKKQSSSSKKLSSSKLADLTDMAFNSNDINLIFNIQLLSNIVKSFTKCKYCSNSDCVVLAVDDSYKNGLAHKVSIQCLVCREADQGMNTSFVNKLAELNLRYIYALRSIGCGKADGRTFSAVMNLAAPNARIQTYNKRILVAASEVCNASLIHAAEEAIKENEGNNDIAACFDGTWQKRGHTSLNGVVTVTSFDTGRVLDFECLSKFCVGCVNKNRLGLNDPVQEELHKSQCSANYSGSSGGMEVAGARRICARSEEKLRVRFTKYLGDGDSKGFEAVLESKPYGPSTTIEKLECVGHVQKRLGTRLRKLKAANKKLKLSDGKGLGGQGRLTGEVIDNLQRYYGLAIRRNLASVAHMKKAIWATFNHKLSTDDDPRHQFCPEGPESWCQYNKALSLQSGTPYTHKRPIPEPIMTAIKPIYNDLTKDSLLKRCLHGKTQNPNESFNSCIWQRIPKTGFAGLETLTLGVTDAVITFNEGSIVKANVLGRMGIKPGKFTIEGLQLIDRERILKADREVQEQNKKKRVRRRLLKRKREDNEGEDYIPGGF